MTGPMTGGDICPFCGGPTRDGRSVLEAEMAAVRADMAALRGDLATNTALEGLGIDILCQLLRAIERLDITEARRCAEELSLLFSLGR